MSYGHAEKWKSQRKQILLDSNRTQKIVLGKMPYRCDFCTIGSQDSKSKVRKMNDQKLTRLRRISKVTHSRKQWTEIEVGNSLVCHIVTRIWNGCEISEENDVIFHSWKYTPFFRKIMLSLTFESVHFPSEKHSLYKWLCTTWYYLKLQ